jgi:DeoR family transcriptional regulator of aga operon/DeoR family fructose operon transcriptional repressor
VLSRFNFDKAFLGAWGITPEDGLMDSSLVEVELKQTILPRCREVNAILDGSKFGRTGIASFASIADLSSIVTDLSAPMPMINLLRNKGINILIASDRTGDG